MNYSIGQFLKISSDVYKVVGSITYSENEKSWNDYLLSGSHGNKWLSIEKDEIALFSEADSASNAGLENVFQGTETVVNCAGMVDIEIGECAHYSDYEDKEGNRIVSMEEWEDGTEISIGYYITPADLTEPTQEEIIQFNESCLERFSASTNNSTSAFSNFIKDNMSNIIKIGIGAITLVVVLSLLFTGCSSDKEIHAYIKDSIQKYEPVTAISGKKDKTYVYRWTQPQKQLDDVAKDIIEGTNGTVQVLEKNDVENNPNLDPNDKENSIAVISPKEFGLIYMPENQNDIYLQVSSRQYIYEEDSEPYHAHHSTIIWYRGAYFSNAYAADRANFKGSSPYDNYKGEKVSYNPNNRLNTHSNSVRQSSVLSRRSSGGGLSFGK